MKHLAWSALALRGGAFIHTKPLVRGHNGFRPCDQSTNSLSRGFYLAVGAQLEIFVQYTFLACNNGDAR